MFAVISFKGKQYKVIEGQECRVDLIEGDDKKIVFDDILLLSDDKSTTVGTPKVAATVEAEVLGETKGKKLSFLKFHSKKRYKRNLGHTERYTLVRITKIKKNEK